MFEIFIKPELYAKISYLFRKSKLEVGALLECYNVGEKIVVEDMFIIEQEVSKGSVDFKEPAVNALLLEFMDTGQEMSGWLHSHNTMASHWSGVDDETIRKLNGYIGKWVLSIVGNMKMELIGRVDYIAKTPFGEESICVDNIPIHTLPEISEDDMAAIDAIVTENVSVKPVYSNVVKGKKGKKGKKNKQLQQRNEPNYADMTDEEIAESFGIDVQSYHAAIQHSEDIENIPTNEMTDDQWNAYCREWF